eukprot:TRINITY_DN1628_c1_g1_i1.p1 TRINITY_DN1628_c1_g1~~TRINITY_DN1628_c1_g1_i1.p1  ORF type:complete len:386 (-),score=79.18 TRINITY_DN1628_c1_g1_i1:81-1238(-)
MVKRSSSYGVSAPVSVPATASPSPPPATPPPPPKMGIKTANSAPLLHRSSPASNNAQQHQQHPLTPSSVSRTIRPHAPPMAPLPSRPSNVPVSPMKPQASTPPLPSPRTPRAPQTPRSAALAAGGGNNSNNSNNSSGNNNADLKVRWHLMRLPLYVGDIVEAYYHEDNKWHFGSIQSVKNKSSSKTPAPLSASPHSHGFGGTSGSTNLVYGLVFHGHARLYHKAPLGDVRKSGGRIMTGRLTSAPGPLPPPGTMAKQEIWKKQVKKWKKNIFATKDAVPPAIKPCSAPYPGLEGSKTEPHVVLIDMVVRPQASSSADHVHTTTTTTSTTTTTIPQQASLVLSSASVPSPSGPGGVRRGNKKLPPAPTPRPGRPDCNSIIKRMEGS